MTLDEIRG